MRKHAYLIICHKYDEALQYLLRSIDDERNDIFIHVDAKASDFDFTGLKSLLRNSDVFFTDRVRVRWAGYSLVEAEMILLAAATRHAEYAYYHFLSGSDMCLKSQDEIHRFFNAHSGKLFLTFCGEDWQRTQAQKRARYYYIEAGRAPVLRAMNRGLVTMQRIVGIDRRKKAGMTIVGGSNWCSLPHDFACYLVEHRAEIRHVFRHGLCPDEIYIHTMAYNSRFKDRIYLLKIRQQNDDMDPDMFRANQRYIDWNRGKPYIFREDDFDELMRADVCFARKFAYTDTNQLMRKILEYNLGRR